MIYIQDLLKSVVEAVSTELTPYLQEQRRSEACTGVHFMYGHQKEIVERLKNMKGPSAFDKYPLIWLYTPFAYRVDRSNPAYIEASLRILIINGSSADLVAEQRYQQNFKPIIHPIMEAFIKKIDTYTIGKYKPFATGTLSYDQIDHDYWGTNQASENELADHLDATELNNFQIKLNLKNC